MPALPGAQMTWVTPGSERSLAERACSRAPLPKTRIRMALHEILREGFAGFEPRRCLRWTEHAAAGGGEPSGKPGGEGAFVADHGQIDPFAIDEPNHRCGVQ